MAVVAPSFQDFLTLGQGEAQFRRPDLAFNDGDITECQNHAAAVMADKVVELTAQYFRNTFFDGAEGDALGALVDDHCNIQRKGATTATVTLTLSRTTTSTSGTIAAGTRFAGDAKPDGSRPVFLLDSPGLAVGIGQAGPFTVTATAADAGPDDNCVAGTITKILDPPFDTTFTVTQPAAAAGGNLEESDPELRKRAKLYFVTLRRGTLAALEFGALTLSAVRTAHATEDPDTFEVTVAVADSDGGSTQQMVADATGELENWRCAGAPLRVVGGTKVLVDLTIQLTEVSAGFDTAAVADQIIAAVQAKIDSRKTGQSISLQSIIAAVIAVAPDDINEMEFPVILVGGVPWIFDEDIGSVDPTVTFRHGTINVIGP